MPKKVQSKQKAVKTQFKLLKKPINLQSSFLKKIRITRHKSIISSVVLCAVVILSIVPATRFSILRLFIRKTAIITLIDATNGTRITEASVTIGNDLYTSDQDGTVHVIAIKPGQSQIKINKLFYKEYGSVHVFSALKNVQTVTFSLQPLGQPTKLTVKNKLSGRFVAGILVKTSHGASARTNSSGVAQVLIPFGLSQESVTLSGSTILETNGTLRPEQSDITNVFSVIPSGRVFYASDESGTLDIIGSNLDGTNKKVILSGTGLESAATTTVIASKNWNFLAVQNSREGTLKTYVLNTKTGELQTIEATNTVQITGWINDSLIYRTTNPTLQAWKKGKTSLFAYNAVQAKTTQLAQTTGEGSTVLDYVASEIPDVFLVNDKVLFTEHWIGSYYYGNRFANKKMTLTRINADGSDMHVVQDWQAGYNAYISARPNDSNELYLHIELDGVQHSYWLYYNNKIAQNDDNGDVFLNGAFTTYLDSPNAQYTLWRQGKNSAQQLNIGDSFGQKAKQIDTLSGYAPYGWYTNDYVLVTDQKGDLYVFGREGIKPGLVAIKIAKIVTPTHDIHGYGEGYQK